MVTQAIWHFLDREERSIKVAVAFNLYISNIMDWYMVSFLSAKIYFWIGNRRCFDFDSFDEIFLLLYYYY